MAILMITPISMFVRPFRSGAGEIADVTHRTLRGNGPAALAAEVDLGD
jgi:hypothetical protein